MHLTYTLYLTFRSIFFNGFIVEDNFLILLTCGDTDCLSFLYPDLTQQLGKGEKPSEEGGKVVEEDQKRRSSFIN